MLVRNWLNLGATISIPLEQQRPINWVRLFDKDIIRDRILFLLLLHVRFLFRGGGVGGMAFVLVEQKEQNNG